MQFLTPNGAYGKKFDTVYYKSISSASCWTQSQKYTKKKPPALTEVFISLCDYRRGSIRRLSAQAHSDDSPGVECLDESIITHKKTPALTEVFISLCDPIRTRT